jgi:hypothetical protein
MRRLQTALVVAGVAAAFSTGSAHAAATAGSVPITQTVFVSCANGGAGDVVELSGSIQIVEAATFDSSGGAHFYSHFNPQGVTGTSASTGTRYQGVGVTAFQLNLTAGVQQVVTNNFLIVGTGSAASYRVHENVVFVLNANGTVTATVDNIRVTCA